MPESFTVVDTVLSQMLSGGRWVAIETSRDRDAGISGVVRASPERLRTGT
jgi:hypothetical protein